ncbi:class I adenylate-forming enzyme family protein [Neobacillus niacini]|uniref:class I adenylate-forming enzyme family protein n=1 Tax=Neobacillus niacini TaxID=86668 RepID=UPI00203B451F|nr:class I adenylate-forming enzyme family protein [Neobacillus niacini]MCM3691189.1 acyl--CoA ligase [Neobacillus niacini]
MIETKTVFGHEVKVYRERPHSVFEMLEKTAASYPHKEAIVDGEVRLTYRELHKKVENVSANFQKRFQIQKGDRVAILLNNCVEFVLSVFAGAKLGAILVPLNTKLKESELAFMINHSGAKALITDNESLPKIDKLISENQLNKVEQIFLKNGSSQGLLSKRFLSFEVLEEPADCDELASIKEEDPLFIMYTSGTTGVPKGAIGSHIGVIHSALSFEKVFQTNTETKTLIAVPLFHVTGLIGQLLHVTRIGGTSVLMSRYQTDKYINILANEKISFLFNVPTIYVMILSRKIFHQFQYPFVQKIAYGGAPMPNDTIYQLRKYFPNAELHNAYGATETSSPTTIMPRHFPDSKINSVGRPVPVAEIKVVNEQMKECSFDEVGELLIKGPMVIKGYWDNPKANQSSFIDGYWASGDLVKVDKHGYVYIMDRKKDMINRGGEKIFSVEIENILYNHPSILEAAVVGVTDPIFGEKVKAFIVKKDGVQMLTGDEIKSFIAARIADFKVPNEVVFVDQLPRNPGGKILKSHLAKL